MNANNLLHLKIWPAANFQVSRHVITQRNMMELLTGATTFATFVGLLCNFKSEHKQASEDEYQEFIEWLRKKRHDRLIEEISSNHLLGLGIKSLLKQNHEAVMAKLTALDKVLLSIASTMEGMHEISDAISPQSKLSNQCVSILKQFEKSGGSLFLEMKMRGRAIYQVLDGSGGNIEIEEPRFVEDDLQTLVDLNLLMLEYNKSGGRVFRITRSAVGLVEQMKE
jgi:hypothetical protein